MYWYIASGTYSYRYQTPLIQEYGQSGSANLLLYGGYI